MISKGSRLRLVVCRNANCPSCCLKSLPLFENVWLLFAFVKGSSFCLTFDQADGPWRAFLTHEPNNPLHRHQDELEKKRYKENTAEMSWQHTLKSDLHCHGPFNVTSNERYTSAERKWRVYLQVQPSWDVETYGAGEKEIRRTLMWLFKVHWTTCDNSLSSCIYSFNVCSSLGDNCLNWCSKCYCFCVRREINSCGVPLCMSGCLIFFSLCILIFISLQLGFLFSFSLSAS